MSLCTNEFHRRKLRVDPDAYERASNRGRPRALDDDETMMAIGFAVHKSRKPEEVHYDTVQAFIREKIGLDVSTATVANICHKNGMAVKIAKVAATEKAGSAASQQAETIEFIGQLEKEGFFQAQQNQIFYVDGTFTSHKSFVQRTVAPVGTCVFLLRIFVVAQFSSSSLPILVFTVNNRLECHRSTTTLQISSSQLAEETEPTRW